MSGRRPKAEHEGVYDQMAAALPGLRFMNTGLAESQDTAYEWVRPEDLGDRYHLNLARRALEGIPLRDARVIELGSGRGGNCHYLSQYTDAEWVYGLDTSFGNLRTAESHHLAKVRFLRADIGHLPLAPGSVDVALNIEWSPAYPEFERLLGEVTRTLADGGFFVYADLWNPYSARVDCAQRQRDIDQSPLRVVSETEYTEEAFQSLDRADGVGHRLARLETPDNRSVVAKIRRELEAAKACLAVGFCTARIIRMQKSSGD